eukprot:TRINITY_DN8737_c0_g1_i3.p1 TRINITY_DN8737_c0_g1~~TRINITY_DN8737_c0_g1_i3.p1  ORF type:complete len:130 (+),score=8.25 TRINITY_DN8737_c0_g1_i3:1677-2066(+)
MASFILYFELIRFLVLHFCTILPTCLFQSLLPNRLAFLLLLFYFFWSFLLGSDDYSTIFKNKKVMTTAVENLSAFTFLVLEIGDKLHMEDNISCSVYVNILINNLFHTENRWLLLLPCACNMKVISGLT